MGNWYKVTKKISGRFYDYWQRTYRAGKSVKTENKYIGLSGKMPPSAGSSNGMTTGFGPGNAGSSPVPATEASTADTAFKPVTLDAIERIEDERIQYGPRAARIRKQKAALRVAKRNTTGIKKLNPFIAQAIKPKEK